MPVSGDAWMKDGISSEDLRRYYDVGWERRWLGRLNAQGLPGDAGYKLRLKRTLALIRPAGRRPLRILDAGCGVGIYAVHLALRFPTARVLGLDVSPVQIAAACELANRFRVSDRTEFRAGDVTNPALESCVGGGWDVVMVAEVLEHLPQPAPVLQTLRSLLAPGGQMLISVPQWTPDDPGEPWIYHRVLTGGPNMDNIESRNRSSLPPGEVYTYYHRHYRPAEVRALLSEAGLEVRHYEGVFWQRPVRSAGWPWRALEYILCRTAWTWVDRLLQAMGGGEWAHTLLWDCRVR